MRSGLTFGAAAAGLLLGLPGPAAAQQSLDQAASDPTASLMSFQLQGYHTPNLHNSDGSASLLQFRAAITFELGGYSNIARVTLPYVTHSASGETGLSDTTLFDLVTFTRPWGRFGFGAVALLPTGSEGVGAGQWALGPAMGFTVQQGPLLWGVFNQNLFSVAERFDGPDVSVSTLQPIVNYSLGQGWSVGTSEMNFVYDWDKGEFTSIPLGIKLAKLVRFGKTPVQFQVNYEHNFYDNGIAPADTIGMTVKLLLPAG
jgi:hypothetical protein